MYRVYLTNFGWFLGDTFNTIAEALTRVKKTGFESAIYGPSGLVASWSVLSGTTFYLPVG